MMLPSRFFGQPVRSTDKLHKAGIKATKLT